MLTNLLWFLEAKMQYQKQREQGLAGLLALLLVLFMAWKWNSIFYPLFDKLGIVTLVGKLGLINEEMGLYTIINITVFIFYLSLFFALALLAISVIGTALSLFGVSKLGSNLIWGSLFILLSPIVFTGLYFERKKQRKTPEGQSTMQYVYSHDKQLKPLLRKYKDLTKGPRMYELYQEQSIREQRAITFISMNDIKLHLNRAVASVADNRNWLLGYDRTNEQWHILFPNPLPEYASKMAEYNHFKPYNSIFNYKKYDIEQLLVENGQAGSEGFYVPSLPIDFTWNSEEKRILPTVKEKAKVGLLNTKFMKTMRLHEDDTAQLFEEVSHREDVANWVTTAHIMVYFIPTAFPSDTPYAAEKRFYHAMKDIPNVDTFFPIYTADVEACKAYFKQQGKDWHTEWFTKVV